MTERRTTLAVVGLGLLVSVIGGFFVWQAVDNQDRAWKNYAASLREFSDLQSMLGARLEKATGHAGMDARFPSEDESLQEQLDGLVARAPDRQDAERLADAIRDTEKDVRADAAADGAADERLLTDLDGDLRELERTVIRPLGDHARTSADSARRTTLIVVVLSIGLWLAVGWLLLGRHTQPNG